jgi:Rps23 Pro-64 3,4-dihydroxylase Tpa1-like proline 4-hydroxylase
MRDGMTIVAPKLNMTNDPAVLATEFARHGHVRVRDVLAPEYAAYLAQLLRGREDWRQVISSDGGAKVVELDRPTQARLTPEQRRGLDEAIYAGARTGFQFRYEAIRVPDGMQERARSIDPLARFAEWMSRAEMRRFVRQITGAAGIDFADAQATAFSPGDLLTAHDDVVEGRNRHAAYVLGLNPTWRPEWGGVLLFHRDAGQVDGHAPAFNTLDVFRVGQMHSVSEVSRASPFRRYSITGWLRSR